MNRCKKLSKDQRFVITLIVFSVLLAFFCYGKRVNSYDATMLAFSYKYGFISRGFIGTMYQLLDKLLPVSLMNYEAVKTYTMIITIIYYLLLLSFFIMCLKRCAEKHKTYMEYAIIFFTIFAVSMFISEYNFGRLDVYLVMLSLIGVMLLVKEKAEWLVIPIAGVCVMIHQGYVFMYFNLLLVLLIYKLLSREGKERKKYLILLALTFAVGSVLFLYFEFFSHVNGAEIYDDLYATAKSICRKGIVHDDVISAEVLGVDLTAKERDMHIQNIVELPFFIVLIMPYIIFAVQYFRGIIKKASSSMEKWKYRLVSAGALTMLPCFILKVDYGRWVFAVICYYMVVVLALMAMGDKLVMEEFVQLCDSWGERSPWLILLLLYPLMLVPFQDVVISFLSMRFANYPNKWWLHVW